MRNSIIPIHNERIISLEKVTSLLGISTATVRNWVKCGNLKTIDNRGYNFHLSEIRNLKANIENGSFEKLNKRANKAKANRTFIPDEYLNADVSIDDVKEIILFIKEKKVGVLISLLLLALNLLQKERIISDVSIQHVIDNQKILFTNKQVHKEIKSWLSIIKINELKAEHSFLLQCPLPKQRDILGLIYQSLLLENNKSQNGSYYTPESIVGGIIRDYVRKASRVLDPCCGTGQFLLSFAGVIGNPRNIYGMDIDEIAVRIARLNLLVTYKNDDFVPNIVCKNTLFEVDNNEDIRAFDVIATNPPWGFHFSKADRKKLQSSFPEITSFESFSYFLRKSIDLLHDNGVISFVLSEAILNVKAHKDIRGWILKNTHIKKVSYLDRVFKNVYTPVIRLDLEKNKKGSGQVKICKKNKRYTVKQAKWEKNQDLIFNIHANTFDAGIIDKVYNVHHTTLSGQADWALGIVTGNNKAYVTDEKQEGFEEIYKGKDIERFVLRKPSNYIYFRPEKFQQIASVEKYRAKEKLIYRFISKNLVFAYDDKKRLTLNSANIVIPKIPNYPMKVIAALLNSSLYQFIFQKKFSSIKVLRSHIEQMPLPLWDEKVFNDIVKLVDKVIEDENNFKKLDSYIIKTFALS